jgi:hypothetical protein
MILYATENFLAGDDVALYSSSEDALYVLENLYCARPSKPFRFTGIGAVGTPEWICAEFDAPKIVTLAGVFNHNLVQTASGDLFQLLACDLGCESGGCNWAAPDYTLDLSGRIVANWNDVYALLNQTRLAWRLEAVDGDNPDGYVEIGEWMLGRYTALASAKLSPGRVETPTFFRFNNRTPYGQHWVEQLSRTINLSLRITNLGDPDVVNDMRIMLEAIHEAGNRVFLVPDHLSPFIYYANLENDSDFMKQILRAGGCEASEWTLEFQCLTRGIRLL